MPQREGDRVYHAGDDLGEAIGETASGPPDQSEIEDGAPRGKLKLAVDTIMEA